MSNDKIMQLACRAYLTDPIPVGWFMTEKSLEQFVELIIRECADAAEEAVSHAIFNTTMHDNDIPNYVRAKVEDICKQNERED